jgi:hypothetical protein
VADLDIVSADPTLKQLYRKKAVEDLTLPDNPTLAALNKFEQFRGRNMPLVVKFGNPQGRSATYAKAEANATATRFEDFLLTRRKDYSVATVDGETAEASQGDSAAFISAVTAQVDGALRSLADSHSMSIFRSGTGSIGQVGALSGAAVTLANTTDVVNFELGMKLQANATDGGAPRAGTEVVGGVNRSTGVLTSTNATWATGIAAIAVNDFLLVDGDNNLKMSGFDGWVPATAPSGSDNWYGVNRSVDSRLFGQVYDGSNGPSMEEICINAQSQGAREGAKIDWIVMNPVRFRDLVKGMQSKVVYQRVAANNAAGEVGRIGFRGVMIDGDEGPITCMMDRRCQRDVAWALTSDSWSLNSIGPATKILQDDSLRMLRVAGQDSYQVRTGFYGNLGCDAPGHQVRIKLA